MEKKNNSRQESRQAARKRRVEKQMEENADGQDISANSFR